ncbi:MAG: GAF domain-containing protein [Syntrophothermus sp.]|nr:GAF domain-containing protein [Syntrophothermus sp.]
MRGGQGRDGHFAVKKEQTAGWDDLTRIIDIGIALTAEKDDNRLLEMILTYARRITRADAGTLYLRVGDYLIFKIMQNDTLGLHQGGRGETISLPSVPMSPDNVSGYVALTGRAVNIADAYSSSKFDFSGPKRYDALTGYRTKSALVVPLSDYEGEVIGVLQLINALNEQGEVVPFSPEYERLVTALASQAATALTKIRFIEEIERLFEALVEVMATAIDALTPYNVTHSRRVAEMARRFAWYLNEVKRTNGDVPDFDDDRVTQLVMAAWLHDIGKVATPLEVMNKATRLGNRLDLVLQRLDYIREKERADSLARELAAVRAGDMEAWETFRREQENILKKVENARRLVLVANDPTCVVNETLAGQIRGLGKETYIDREGRLRNWLTEEEVECLTVPRGTLTPKERKIMEDHVRMTGLLLEKVPFTRKLKDVPRLAVSHHEYLDGEGYPLGLKGDEIELEARILAILDVFDALTADDRPYKKAISVDEALKILGRMAEQGKLDRKLYEYFCASRVWEDCNLVFGRPT